MANKTERVLRTGDRANRPKRIPVSGQRDIITVEGQDPDFVYRIVNDSKPGRVDRFLLGGYEIVTQEVKVGDPGASRDVSEGTPTKINLGRGEIGYLMRIPREYFEEDQQAKEEALLAREAEMLDRATRETYGKIEIKRGSQT